MSLERVASLKALNRLVSNAELRPVTYSSGVGGGNFPESCVGTDARFAAAGTGGPQRKKIESVLAHWQRERSGFLHGSNSVSRKYKIRGRDTARGQNKTDRIPKNKRGCVKRASKGR